MVLKRVGIGSAAKLAGAINGAMGLLLGLIFGLVSLFGAGLAQMTEGAESPQAWVAPLFGVGAIFLFPILYGVMGLIAGAISAALYNLFARWVGGLVVELE